MPCAACGYNLRGLTLVKVCPECGSPITRSVFGNQLRYSEPGWVEKLRRGAALLRWSIVASILLGLVAVAVAAIFRKATGGGGLRYFQVFPFLVVLVPAVMGLAGAFLITAQEPRIALTEDPVTLGKVVRYCALAFFGGEVLRDTGRFGGGGKISLAARGKSLWDRLSSLSSKLLAPKKTG
ncbi:MAG: hypothetical protein V2A79_16005 [Planctomycetota bacterium]